MIKQPGRHCSVAQALCPLATERLVASGHNAWATPALAYIINFLLRQIGYSLHVALTAKAETL